MLAAKLFGAGDFRLVECEIPEISEDEILLKTKAAAICGTDLRMIANGYKNVDEEHPRTLGHEISGIIERVGKNVKGYTKGMHVALAPNMGCGICDRCISGDTHLCESYQAFGINIDGGFAEYVRIPAAAISQGNIMILDDSVSFADAAVLEPMSCVRNGQSLTGIRINDTVLVVGAGPIGIMHALLAKASGASKVFVSDLSEERLKQCTDIEPSLIPVYGADVKDRIMAETKNKGVDVCITACPSPAAQANSLELMAMNGRVLFFGGLPAGRDQVTLPTNLIHYKQLAIHGSTRANVEQYREVAKMVESGILDLSKIVTNTFPLKDMQEAIAFAKSAKGLKSVITFE